MSAMINAIMKIVSWIWKKILQPFHWVQKVLTGPKDPNQDDNQDPEKGVSDANSSSGDAEIQDNKKWSDVKTEKDGFASPFETPRSDADLAQKATAASSDIKGTPYKEASHSLSRDDEESRCLKQFLKSLGSDDEIFKFLTKKAITTLKELQLSINDEAKAEVLQEISNKIDIGRLSESVIQEEILSQLGLIEYFPKEITLQTAMIKSIDGVSTLHDVPWYLLSKVLMLDYRSRDDFPQLTESEADSCDENIHTDEPHDDIFAQFDDDMNESLHSTGLHPMDVLIAVFQCSSNSLRQVLCEKLFVCKLSIPLLLPPFFGKKSTLLQWSLRNIIVNYRTAQVELCESSFVNCPTSVVSCLRLGKISKSKSKFLNEILNDQRYNTFFHKDCNNGMLERKMSNGVIELAFMLPSIGRSCEQGHSDKVISLINQRGDGLEHRKNMDFLLSISNICLVMVDISEIENTDVISYLKSVTSSKSELVLMLGKHAGTKVNEKCKDTITKFVKAISSQSSGGDNVILEFTTSGKNMKELRDEVMAKINKLVEKKPLVNIIERFEALKDDLDIKIEENDEDCLHAKNLLHELVERVHRCDPEKTKKELLPLQNKFWQEWAKLDKEEHRTQKSNADCIKIKKNELRNEQTKCFRETNFIGSFIDLMNNTDDNNKDYIMKWLKIFLDDISRQRIPNHQKAYCSKWNDLCQATDSKESERLQVELKNLEINLANASFGIEHLMREIGQVYESYYSLENTNSDQDDMAIISSLPHMMADLLLQGFPLELMDGDASHVPLIWVKAVLQELEKRIGRGKKLFVLSVLGAQSSGKSTLLNTMFGLQFPVAAGRCTRGVYAQLVPLKKEQNMNYDYILVVDTEGLKAPELSREKYNHDNEIATLATGLGDVTLINIKGENVSEIQDVLQTVVHALLKMRLANKSLNLQPTCLFLHQNVSVPDAPRRMKSGQQKFVEILDKVTKTTGVMENASHISKLNQIIDFDVNKHIWYFSDLWEGDPPMAPANPGYSDKISKLKSYLLTDIMRKSPAYLTVSKLNVRIEDLWKGILNENFVFSLKNSVESRAYISLDNTFIRVTEDLKKNVSTWLLKIREEMNQQASGRLPFENAALNEFERYFEAICTARKKELSTYFAVSEDHEVIEQWKEIYMTKLNETFQEIYSETINSLKRE